jgi:hypothetical protein
MGYFDDILKNKNTKVSGGYFSDILQGEEPIKAKDKLLEGGYSVAPEEIQKKFFSDIIKPQTVSGKFSTVMPNVGGEYVKPPKEVQKQLEENKITSEAAKKFTKQSLQTILDKTINTDKGKIIIDKISSVTENIPLKIWSAIEAAKTPQTYKKVYGELKKAIEDPNVPKSGYENFAIGLQSSLPQTAFGVALSAIPFAGTPLSYLYWTALSADEEIRRDGKVTGLSGVGNIAIDVALDRVLGNSIEAMLKVGGKSLLSTLAKNGSIEGGTEVAQSLLKFANRYVNEPENRDAIIAEAKNYFKSGAILNEFAVGAVAGAGIAGATHIATGQQILTPQQMMEIKKNPMRGSIKIGEEDPLIQEARKYKSAEEFVKGISKQDGFLFHGTKSGNEIKNFNLKKANWGVGSNAFAQGNKGIYLTDELQSARYFSRKAGEFSALMDEKIPLGQVKADTAWNALFGEKDGNIIVTKLKNGTKKIELDYYPSPDDIAKLSKQGYEAITFPEEGLKTIQDYPMSKLGDTAFNAKTTLVLNPKAIEVKQNIGDLREIWNKANTLTPEQLQQELKEPKKLPITVEQLGIKPKAQLITKREDVLLRIKLKAEAFGAKLGYSKSRKQAILVRQMAKYFGLSDTDIKSISRKDVRLMGKEEFDKFLAQFETKAKEIQDRKQIVNQINQQIEDKQIDINKARLAFDLPKMSEMTNEELQQFDEALSKYQKGDIFFSNRRAKVMERAGLEDAKTYREVLKKLSEKMGIPLSELEKIPVVNAANMKRIPTLMEENQVLAYFINEITKEQLVSEGAYYDIKKQTKELFSKIKDKGGLIPTQPKLKKYIEALPEDKLKMASEMTKEELDFANFVIQKYSEYYDYLIKIEALKSSRFNKQNYLTSLKRSFLEAWKNDGFLKAVGEIFDKNELETNRFNVIENGRAVGFDKFLGYTMKRTGAIEPTQNVFNAFLTYARAMERKIGLDRVTPLIDTYTKSIVETANTKDNKSAAVEFDKFMVDLLKAEKGQNKKLLIQQGGKIDRYLRAFRVFTTIKDLALNIPLMVSMPIGEKVIATRAVGLKKYLLGATRRLTKQGKRITREYQEFTGESAWEQLREPAKQINDRLADGLFYIFARADWLSKSNVLLGSLTEEEFKTGNISPERLAEIKLNYGRFKHFREFKSLLGRTPEFTNWTQYKDWAVPVLGRTLTDLKRSKDILSKSDITQAQAKNAVGELLKTLGVIGFVYAAKLIFVDDDEKDDSVIGKIKQYAWRELGTLLQAIDPTNFVTQSYGGAFQQTGTALFGRTGSFLGEFIDNLILLVKLEEYKTGENKGELKGAVKIEKQLIPRVITQFEDKETEDKYGGLPSLPPLPKLPKLPSLPKL